MSSQSLVRKTTVGTKFFAYIGILILTIVATGLTYVFNLDFEKNILLADKQIAIAKSTQWLMSKS
jgi:hypothetical protein